MVSAGLMGYPSPAILNWNNAFDDPNLVEGGSHLAKITGAHEYLNNLDSSHDESLVLMVDAYDIWLQLRPQVLIDRYHEINRRADERAKKELGRAVVERNNITQKIVIGCQKRCWPWTFNDPPCYASPTSTLPNDIYGPETDTMIENGLSEFQKYRQRFLNSGVMMGTVGAMRKLFNQAMKYLEEEPNIGSDQYIFSHIFGDQMIYRETLLNNPRKTIAKYKSWNGADSPEPELIRKHLEEVRNKAEAREDKNFEFGIGIDHESMLGLNTVFAEDDTEWLLYNDTYQLHLAQEERNIDTSKRRANHLNEDIAKSLPPFWTFTSEPYLPNRWTPWTDVPLFTNVYTGITPAVIHHNAHREGRKALRETWWNKTWYAPHLRTMYDISMYAPTLPVARSAGRLWWPYETWKGGGRNGIAMLGTVGDDWIGVDNICKEFSEELWRDDKGEWAVPES